MLLLTSPERSCSLISRAPASSCSLLSLLITLCQIRMIVKLCGLVQSVIQENCKLKLGLTILLNISLTTSMMCIPLPVFYAYQMALQLKNQNLWASLLCLSATQINCCKYLNWIELCLNLQFMYIGKVRAINPSLPLNNILNYKLIH